MGFYAIGIGGTGAKCLEALTHLCAAGLLPGDLTMIFVDPDKSNGCLERAAQTAKLYQSIKGSVNFGSSHVFRTKITIPEPDIWSPFDNQANLRLDHYFSKAALDQTSKDLFNVLYTQKEQETPLDMGFRGHPSIGSAVFAESVDIVNGEPWSTFWHKVSNDVNGGEGRIFLFGSIFGGTGASGFPTIAKIIRQNLIDKEGMPVDADNMRIGGALMLPYFTFKSSVDDELKARSEEFLVNSQAALKYYNSRYGPPNSKLFDALYLLGDDDPQQLSNDKTSLGGATQKNSPHFVELYAAFAALDFFTRTEFHSTRVVNFISRESNSVWWTDLPSVATEVNNNHKIGKMTKFCFAYLHKYYPIFESIMKDGKGITEPWYIDFFDNNLNNNELKTIYNELNLVKKYCESFLLWLGSIELEKRVELVESKAFSVMGTDSISLKEKHQFETDAFIHLILPSDHGSAKNDRMFNLLESMCDAYPGDQPAANFFGNFISTLYSKC